MSTTDNLKMTEWSGMVYEGCYHIESFMDVKAIRERHIDKVWDVRDSDVVVSTFPKSGTTWMTYALMSMYDDLNWKVPGSRRYVELSDINVNLDVLTGLFHQHVKSIKTSMKDIPSPRLMACHLPPQCYPNIWKAEEKKCKIINITRNPKDVCVSFYSYIRHMKYAKMELTWEEWVPAFIEGKVWFGPWLQHVLGWHKYGLQDNVLHLYFEDMKKDLKSCLLKVAEFLNRPLTDEKMNKVVQQCSFESMQDMNAPSRIWGSQSEGSWDEKGSFLRKGQIGSWKQKFTVAQNELFNEALIAEVEKSGLNLQYEP
ncbi:sulfotransferase 1 family member D1-like [Glandiceps talaboti]